MTPAQKLYRRLLEARKSRNMGPLTPDVREAMRSYTERWQASRVMAEWHTWPKNSDGIIEIVPGFVCLAEKGNRMDATEYATYEIDEATMRQVGHDSLEHSDLDGHPLRESLIAQREVQAEKEDRRKDRYLYKLLKLSVIQQKRRAVRHLEKDIWGDGNDERAGGLRAEEGPPRIPR